MEKIKRKILLFLCAFISIEIAAHTNLAFFEFYDYHGKLIQLEKGSRFSHVALSNGDIWIHAHPAKGEVEAVLSLKEMNFFRAQIIVLSHPDLTISSDRLKEYIGAPYDHLFEWRGRSFYNAELVAHLLNLAPGLMDFSAPYWQSYPYPLPHSTQGISPDDLYRDALDLGFVEVPF